MFCARVLPIPNRPELSPLFALANCSVMYVATVHLAFMERVLRTHGATLQNCYCKANSPHSASDRRIHFLSNTNEMIV